MKLTEHDISASSVIVLKTQKTDQAMLNQSFVLKCLNTILS